MGNVEESLKYGLNLCVQENAKESQSNIGLNQSSLGKIKKTDFLLDKKNILYKPTMFSTTSTSNILESRQTFHHTLKEDIRRPLSVTNKKGINPMLQLQKSILENKESILFNLNNLNLNPKWTGNEIVYYIPNSMSEGFIYKNKINSLANLNSSYNYVRNIFNESNYLINNNLDKLSTSMIVGISNINYASDKDSVLNEGAANKSLRLNRIQGTESNAGNFSNEGIDAFRNLKEDPYTFKKKKFSSFSQINELEKENSKSEFSKEEEQIGNIYSNILSNSNEYNNESKLKIKNRSLNNKNQILKGNNSKDLINNVPYANTLKYDLGNYLLTESNSNDKIINSKDHITNISNLNNTINNTFNNTINNTINNSKLFYKNINSSSINSRKNIINNNSIITNKDSLNNALINHKKLNISSSNGMKNIEKKKNFSVLNKKQIGIKNEIKIKPIPQISKTLNIISKPKSISKERLSKIEKIKYICLKTEEQLDTTSNKLDDLLSLKAKKQINLYEDIENINLNSYNLGKTHNRVNNEFKLTSGNSKKHISNKDNLIDINLDSKNNKKIESTNSLYLYNKSKEIMFSVKSNNKRKILPKYIYKTTNNLGSISNIDKKYVDNLLDFDDENKLNKRKTNDGLLNQNKLNEKKPNENKPIENKLNDNKPNETLKSYIKNSRINVSYPSNEEKRILKESSSSQVRNLIETIQPSIKYDKSSETIEFISNNLNCTNKGLSNKALTNDIDDIINNKNKNKNIIINADGCFKYNNNEISKISDQSIFLSNNTFNSSGFNISNNKDLANNKKLHNFSTNICNENHCKNLLTNKNIVDNCVNVSLTREKAEENRKIKGEKSFKDILNQTKIYDNSFKNNKILPGINQIEINSQGVYVFSNEKMKITSESTINFEPVNKLKEHNQQSKSGDNPKINKYLSNLYKEKKYNHIAEYNKNYYKKTKKNNIRIIGNLKSFNEFNKFQSNNNANNYKETQEIKTNTNNKSSNNNSLNKNKNGYLYNKNINNKNINSENIKPKLWVDTHSYINKINYLDANNNIKYNKNIVNTNDYKRSKDFNKSKEDKNKKGNCINKDIKNNKEYKKSKDIKNSREYNKTLENNITNIFGSSLFTDRRNVKSNNKNGLTKFRTYEKNLDFNCTLENKSLNKNKNLEPGHNKIRAKSSHSNGTKNRKNNINKLTKISTNYKLKKISTYYHTCSTYTKSAMKMYSCCTRKNLYGKDNQLSYYNNLDFEPIYFGYESKNNIYNQNNFINSLKQNIQNMNTAKKKKVNRLDKIMTPDLPKKQKSHYSYFDLNNIRKNNITNSKNKSINYNFNNNNLTNNTNNSNNLNKNINFNNNSIIEKNSNFQSINSMNLNKNSNISYLNFSKGHKHFSKKITNKRYNNDKMKNSNISKDFIKGIKKEKDKSKIGKYNSKYVLTDSNIPSVQKNITESSMDFYNLYKSEVNDTNYNSENLNPNDNAINNYSSKILEKSRTICY